MKPYPLIAVATPPPAAHRMGSDDPDEVTSWVARRDGDHSRVVHGTGPYGFQLSVVETSSVQLAWAKARLAHTVRGRFRQPTFHFPLSGVQHYSWGRRRLAVDTGEPVFMAPGTDATRRSEDHPVLAIDLDAATFESEVQRRCGTDRVYWPRVPLAPRLSEPGRRELLDAIAGLVHAHEPGAPTASGMHVESRLLAALAGALTWPASSRIPPVSSQRLNHLEGWIDAHLGQAITLGRLCEVVKVGERSLQIAFQARRGMSPMRFVAERRLAAAQRWFAGERAGEGVTAIATSLGFTHLGRFSAAYREAFGESPSKTIARNRRCVSARPVARRPGPAAADPPRTP